MQANKLTGLTQSLVSLIQVLDAKIAANTDATTWEGSTKTEYTASLKALFQGTTTLTSKEIDDKVEQALADISALDASSVGLGLLDNFATATKLEAEDSVTPASDKFVTVERTYDVVKKWFADEVSTNPETLDSFKEIADAIEANQDAFTAIETVAASKVAQTTFDQAVLDINAAIAAIVADNATFVAGTATDKAASVKDTVDFVNAQVLATSDADADALAAIFTDIEGYVDGTNPWPAAE